MVMNKQFNDNPGEGIEIVKDISYDESESEVYVPSAAKPDTVDLAVAVAKEKESAKKSALGKISRLVARNPGKYLIGALIVATIVSYIAIDIGNFNIEVDNAGWKSRSTTIANREMQVDVVDAKRSSLFYDEDGSAWSDAQNNVARGYIELEARRRLSSDHQTTTTMVDYFQNNIFGYGNTRISSHGRKLEGEETCDTDSFYSSADLTFGEDNLYAMWKLQPDDDVATKSMLDNDILLKICVAETNTLEVLDKLEATDSSTCSGCSETSGRCLPPHSLVLLLRNYVADWADKSCSDLMDLYTAAVQEEFTASLVKCVNEFRDQWDPATQTLIGVATSCPSIFLPHLVDAEFGINGNTNLRYTSSVFYTDDMEAYYKGRDDFDGSDGEILSGVYDTTYGSINEKYVDILVQSDMLLAVASLTVTFLAMGVHTRSAWLTMIGILQIIYAIPLAYFVYVFIANLKFFPFLNFIGVFVAAALGADDLFVAVDKWKNARIQRPYDSVEDIAEVVFPDAAGAMLLTTSTTAVAFFATCICPVAPILAFAVFCGLMVAFNYIMNVLLVFPALCIYDNWIENGKDNFLVSCSRKKKDKNLDDSEGFERISFSLQSREDMSFIHKILSYFADFLHKFRWPIFVLSIVAIGLCIYFGTQLSLPQTSEVRLLPKGHPLENHFVWSMALLSAALYSTGSGVEITFGLIPGDTGSSINPDELSKLLLDNTFDPSLPESQEYLLNFCERLFTSGFAFEPYSDYRCPINSFNDWLETQSSLDSQDIVYTENCSSADGLPMDPAAFDACLIAWSKETVTDHVLADRGAVKILTIQTRSNINGGNAAQTVIGAELQKYEDWLQNEFETAPSSVNKAICTSSIFWWYDTNQQMVKTAVGAVAIALGFSAAVVLFSSRSLILTLFTFACILYVLAATTASLVGLGWELGFLESICFAIMVGISCDFVIHFGHAYIHEPGSVSKEFRTRHAILHMGPSILAAAVTTLSSALVMLFCKVVFFTKFAVILLMAVIHATIGSFVIYLVLCNLFGPSEPTKFIDGIATKCLKCCGKNADDETNDLALKEENRNSSKVSVEC